MSCWPGSTCGHRAKGRRRHQRGARRPTGRRESLDAPVRAHRRRRPRPRAAPRQGRARPAAEPATPFRPGQEAPAMEHPNPDDRSRDRRFADVRHLFERWARLGGPAGEAAAPDGPPAHAVAPCLRRRASSVVLRLRRRPRGADERPAMARPRILVVDDDEAFTLLAREFLTDAGYAVARRLRGVEALATARARPPALVLLDVRMPGLGGLAVL